MDQTIAVMAGGLVVAIAIVVIVAKVGINYGRRRTESRVRRAQGEFEPPEPPEGRYWG
jgi:hypothetical protein